MADSLAKEDADPAALFAEAREHHKAGRFAEALALLDRTAALRPKDAIIENARGNALDGLHRLQEALESYERAIALAPDYAFAHYNRGSMLFRFDRFADALASYDRAAELNPDLAPVYRNRGVVLRRIGRWDEALADFDRAVDLAPDYTEAYYSRGYSRLQQGLFADGWRDYERRWEVDSFVRESAGHASPAFRARFDPATTLENLAGADVLLVGEQGIGDILMFASIIPDLMAVAGRLTLLCDLRLRRLLSHAFPALRMVSADEAAGELAGFGRVLPIGSLGRLFRNRAEDFPGVPYLSASDAARNRWAERLGPRAGRARIGLSWRGGAPTTGGATRSLRLAELRPVLDLPDCEFVSLQYGVRPDETAGFDVRLFQPEEIDDFDDLAALVQNLDLVVSVQTSLVHLSGALGAPALVMVPANAEWRYGDVGPSMVWYRSVRLFRQDEDGGWGPVVKAVAAAAAERLGR